MIVKKVNSRYKDYPSNHMGVRDGKLYYGHRGEGFDPIPMAEYFSDYAPAGGRGLYILRRNTFPEGYECSASGSPASFKTDYDRRFLTVSNLRGIKGKPYTSTKGITAGTTFVFKAFGLQAVDLSTSYCVHQDNIAPRDTDSIRNLDFYGEVLYETQYDFIVFCRDATKRYSYYGCSRLYAVSKTVTNSTTLLLCGHFDCVFLGMHNGANSPRATFAITSNQTYSRSGSATAAGGMVPVLNTPTWGSFKDPANDEGAALYILELRAEGSLTQSSAWTWLHARKIGKGLINAGFGGLKMMINNDQSMVVETAEGYLQRFSFIGHTAELGAEVWTYTGSGAAPRMETLQDTLGIIHLDFSTTGDSTTPFVTSSYQPIPLPQNVLDLEWVCAGNSTVVDLTASLIQGRAWRANSKQYVLLTNSATFARYAASSAVRVDANFPTLLVQADVDAYGNLSNVSIEQLPQKLGHDVCPFSFLLNETRDIVWMPDALRTDKIAVLDLRTPSPTIHVASVPKHTSYGTDGARLLVVSSHFPSQEFHVVEFGEVPQISLSFDKAAYAPNEDGIITIISDADCNMQIQLIQCTSNGASVLDVQAEANVPISIQVTIMGHASAHVLSVE